MADGAQFLKLTERPVFEKTVALFKRIIADKIVDYRFSRGGNFRAVLKQEKINEYLKGSDLNQTDFHEAVSEIVSYLNAIVFSKQDDFIFSKLNNPATTAQKISDDDKKLGEKELQDRIDYVSREIDFKELGDRARLRQSAPMSTFDSISWSVVKGEFISGDHISSSANFAVLTFSLYRPVAGRIFSNHPLTILVFLILLKRSPRSRRKSHLWLM